MMNAVKDLAMTTTDALQSQVQNYNAMDSTGVKSTEHSLTPISYVLYVDYLTFSCTIQK